MSAEEESRTEATFSKRAQIIALIQSILASEDRGSQSTGSPWDSLHAIAKNSDRIATTLENIVTHLSHSGWEK